MTVVTVGIIGIMTVLMAVQLKSLKGEYGLYLVLAAACVIFFYGTLRLRGILEGMQKIQNMIRINPVYLNTLLKMTGITYIAEFSSGICKDAGYGALGTQIEIFGKLSILAVSLPVILALLDTLQGAKPSIVLDGRNDRRFLNGIHQLLFHAFPPARRSVGQFYWCSSSQRSAI